jgi:DNA-binding NarL/FixJ family response regulator
MATSSTDQTARRTGLTRVVIVDEFPIFAEALGVVISREKDLVYAGCATTPEDAVELVMAERADVVVLDMDLPTPGHADFDGIDATKQIKAARPETRVLVLTGLLDVDAMARTASAGACGFLSKSSTLEDICDAIRTAKDGGMFVERDLIGPLVDRIHKRSAIRGGSTRADITPREQDVLTLLGEGLDVTAIARRLDISINTCRGHVQSLLIKLGSHTQLEAVVEAVHQGLLPHLSR